MLEASNERGILLNRLAASLFTACVLLPGVLSANPGVHVVVDTQSQTLTVFEGDRVAERFENIAIGRAGSTPDKRHRDNKTPLGQYRISRIKHDSDYHLFLGFDFPTEAQARRALKSGRISRTQYDTIAAAAARDRLPPQNTPLGGYIGIHGIGDGDPGVHEAFNWTEGCIALTNEEVDRLARRVRMGTLVRVK